MTTPILLIIFNRHHTLKSLFKVLEQVKPSQLFIAADGPRAHKGGEGDLCAETRDFALRSVTWPCEVKTLFQTENLGCGRAVSTAITWFFENIESGIILEDDCLPELSFFDYASSLLKRFNDNPRIMHISGNNPLGVIKNSRTSYQFTNLQFCWGWATWRRAWSNYRFQLSDSSDEIDQVIESTFRTGKERATWKSLVKKIKNLEIDTWDYQWSYAIFKSQGLCIVPAKNLVTNLGFDGSGTHTFNSDSDLANQKTYAMSELIHPRGVELNRGLGLQLNQKVHDVPLSLLQRAINKIKKVTGLRK